MEEDFEVPSAHEHALEHEAHHGVELSQQVAIFTAILATLGAIVSYLGGHTQNEALYYKNDAVLNRTLAADQWAFYQASGIKQNVAETLAETATDPAQAAKLKEYAQKKADEKAAIMEKAKQYDAASDASNTHAEHALHPHEKLAMAMTFIQIAISAASITALTRRRWLFVLAAASAVAGIGVGIWAFAA
jgi:hypothetical protein